MNRVFAILLLLPIVQPSIAALKTSEVFGWCTALESVISDPEGSTQKEWYKAGLCDGFFSGFGEGEFLQYMVGIAGKADDKTGEQISHDFQRSRAWCEPAEGISKRQRVMMFNQYVRKHPEMLHKDVSMAIYLAMKPHFPCED